MRGRHNSVVRGQLVVIDPARLHGCEEHRGSRKNALSIALNKVRCRRANRDDKVRWPLRVEGL